LQFRATFCVVLCEGTDSRIGVGYRLGPFADFQVLLELGPQNYTQPIGVVDNSINPAKRYSPPYNSNVDPLELQRLEKSRYTDRESRSRTSFQKGNSVPDPVAERSKAWLSRWRSSVAANAPVAPATPMPPPEPVDPVQRPPPAQRTPKTAAYSESSAPSAAGYRQQSPGWNYPKFQRLRQLYAMATKG